MAVNEMGTRLANDPETVPSHVLIKFVAEANKAAERRQLQESAVTTDPRSLLDRIDALPKTHGRDLLRREIGRLQLELDSYKSKLEQLKQ